MEPEADVLLNEHEPEVEDSDSESDLEEESDEGDEEALLVPLEPEEEAEGEDVEASLDELLRWQLEARSTGMRKKRTTSGPLPRAPKNS